MYRYIKLLLSICIICTAVVQECLSSFSTVRTFEGDYDVALSCNDSFPPNVAAHWTRSGDATFYKTGAKLDFPEISRNDSGNYTCFWNGGPFYNASVDTVHLDVQYPVEMTHFNVSPEYPLENHMLTINCGVIGNPHPNLTIESNGTDSDGVYFHATGYMRANMTGNGTMQVRTSECGHFQVISCHGENLIHKWGGAIEETAHRSQTVFTYCPPRPTYLERKQTTGRGDYIYVSLPVIGYPTPTITWSRDDGQPIQDPERFNGTEFQIRGLLSSDFGNYTMTASNMLGNCTSRFYLKDDGKYYPHHTDSAPTTVFSVIIMAIALLFSKTLTIL